MSGVLVVLAAGASARMGLPKALLEARGRTFLETLTAAGEAAGLEVLAVIGGPHAADIAHRHPGLALCANPGWEAGQWSSVQAGLNAALQRAPEVVLVHPVDCPLVPPAAFAAVAEHARQGQVVVAASGQTPGHPVGLPRAVAERLAGLPPSMTLEFALAEELTVRLELGSEVLVNLNTPERYLEVFGHLPRLAPGASPG